MTTVHVRRLDWHATAHMDDDEDSNRSHSEEHDDDDDKTEPPSPSPTGTDTMDGWDYWRSNLAQQTTFTTTTTPSSLSTKPSSGHTSETPTSTNLNGNSARPATSPATSPTEVGSQALSSQDGTQKPNNVHVMATAIVVPAVTVLFIGAIVFFCLRKRRKQKKQKQIAAVQAKVQEMASRGPPITRAHVGSADPPPQQSSHSAPSAPPSEAPSAVPTLPEPVILGPISSGSSGNYLTGIDTSDVMSVHDEDEDRTGLGNPFADNSSLSEEPPPPYRPRSVATSSRNTSVRSATARRAPGTSSNTSLAGDRGQASQSPFDDSQEDTMSDMSGRLQRRNVDNMSIVSDLSYQREPVVGKPVV